MLGPVTSSLSLPPVDGEPLAVLLDRLNDDQKRYVVQQLLPSILAGVREPRTLSDADGHVLGYYMPMTSLDGNDLLGGSVSDSGSFRFSPGPSERPSPQGQTATMPRRKKSVDLFAPDLGGSD